MNWHGADGLRPLLVPIGELTPDPQNSREHDAKNLAAIEASLRQFGQHRAAVAQLRPDGTKVVRVGNGMLEAARKIGWSHVAALSIEESDERAAARAVADNRAGELAAWNLEQLAATIDGLPDDLVASIGFSSAEIDRLLGPAPALAGADDAPDLPSEPTSRPGDTWVCGAHRLLCADATDAVAVARVMEGQRAAAMWSDPPFGVEYVGGTKEALTIQNDTAEGLPALLRNAFAVANGVLEPGAPFYIAHPTGPLAFEFESALRHVGWRHHETLVWVKDALVLGHSDYHLRHEGILYGWTAGPGRSGRGSHAGSRWYGDNAQTSVFEIPRPKRSEAHPTMKPVELVARCLANSTKRGDLVFEPFSGSGSTLLACEQLGRSCRAVEIDGRYVDVAVQRWESVTGRKAERRPA
jgi:DNA modification methylase